MVSLELSLKSRRNKSIGTIDRINGDDYLACWLSFGGIHEKSMKHERDFHDQFFSLIFFLPTSMQE